MLDRAGCQAWPMLADSEREGDSVDPPASGAEDLRNTDRIAKADSILRFESLLLPRAGLEPTATSGRSRKISWSDPWDAGTVPRGILPALSGAGCAGSGQPRTSKAPRRARASDVLLFLRTQLQEASVTEAHLDVGGTP